TELHAGERGELEAVTWRDRLTGAVERHEIHHVFLFVGADPETEWLGSCGAPRAKGFVLTRHACANRDAGSLSAVLETSVAGVFAVGDVRAGSVKRVGGAIGEGAAVVALIHQYLTTTTAS